MTQIQEASHSATVTHHAEKHSPAPMGLSILLRPRKAPICGDDSAEDFDLNNVRGSSDEEGSERDTWSPTPQESSSGK